MTDFSIFEKNLEIIKIGKNTVYILAKSQSISDDLFRGIICEEDQLEADKIKHNTRRYEYCASRALLKYIFKLEHPLKKSPHGNLEFPAPFHGSISHKDGHIIISTSDDPKIAGLGVDIEKVSRVSTSIEKKILTPSELNRFISQTDAEILRTIVFSFKESIFKAINPQCGTFFYFHDAEVDSIDLSNRSISGRIIKNLGKRFSENYKVEGSFLDMNLEGERFIVTLCLDYLK